MFQKDKKRGFTLVETIIAVFVLVIGIVGVLQAYPLGIKTNRFGKMATMATQLAQAEIEQKFAKSYSELLIGTLTEDYGAITDFENHKRATEISCVNSSDLAEVACNYDAANDPFPMKKVEVTVSWKSSLLGITERDVTLVTLFGRK